MNFSKLLKSGVVLVSILALFTSCTWFDKGPGDAKEIVTEGFKKAQEVKSGDYIMSLNGEMSPSDNAKGEEVSKNGLEKLVFNAVFSGVYDSNDSKNPKFTLALDGKGSLNGGKEENLKAEIKGVSADMYLMLDSMSDFGNPMYTAFTSSILKQWYKIAMPEGAATSYLSKSEEDMTPEEKKLKELFQNTSLWKKVKYKGKETVDGADSYKYSVVLDKDALKEFFVKSAEISGNPMLSGGTNSLDKFLDNMEFEGFVWIAKSDMTFRKLGGEVEIEDIEGVDAELTMTYAISNLNGTVKVEIPENAKEFDPMSLLGGLGAGMAEPAVTEPAVAEPEQP
jgi:hypothetical protein